MASWKEVVNGGRCFTLLQAPKVSEKETQSFYNSEDGELYAVPSLSLWAGTPVFTAKELLRSGADISGVLQKAYDHQLLCFIAKSQHGTLETNVETSYIQSSDIPIIAANVKIPSGLATPEQTATERPDIFPPPTGDSGVYCTPCSVMVSTDHVSETESEKCYTNLRLTYQREDSVLPGLWSLHPSVSLQEEEPILPTFKHSQTDSSLPPLSPESYTVPCASRESLTRDLAPNMPNVRLSQDLQEIDLTKDEGIVIDDSSSCEMCDSDNDVMIVKVEGRGDVVKRHGFVSSANQIPVVSCCGVSLTQYDLDTLRPYQWLNDQVINAYMKLLMKWFNPRHGTKVKVHITSTFFYTKLRTSGYTGVERWLKNVNMSRLRLLMVPVHLGTHWTLAVVDFKRKKLKQFVLKYALNKNSGCYRKGRFFGHWKLCYPKDIPQQNNGSDCGVFVCQFARWLCYSRLGPSRNLSRQPPFTHTHMPLIRAVMIKELKSVQLLTHDFCTRPSVYSSL